MDVASSKLGGGGVPPAASNRKRRKEHRRKGTPPGGWEGRGGTSSSNSRLPAARKNVFGTRSSSNGAGRKKGGGEGRGGGSSSSSASDPWTLKGFTVIRLPGWLRPVCSSSCSGLQCGTFAEYRRPRLLTAAVVFLIARAIPLYKLHSYLPFIGDIHTYCFGVLNSWSASVYINAQVCVCVCARYSFFRSKSQSPWRRS